MPGIPLVRSAALNPSLRAMEELGAPVDACLERAALPPSGRLPPDSLVSLQQALDFIGAVHEAVGLRDMPMRIARHTHLADLGTWGERLLAARTLGQLLRTAARTASLHSSGERIWLEPSGDEVLFCHRFDPRLGLGRGEVQVQLLLLMLDAVRQTVGPTWSPRDLTLEVPLEQPLEELGIPAPARVTGVLSLPIPRHLLDLPSRRVVSLASRRQSDVANLGETAPAPVFVDSLRQLLFSLASTPQLDLPRVAELARLSARTLQRRLTRLGVSFRDLHQEAQLARAISLMQQPTVRITDIAFDLGFSDPAHFTRAFRRWTGSPPRAFRDSLARVHGEAAAEAS